MFPGLLRPSSPYQVHAGDVQLPPVNELVKSEEEMTTARKALAKYLLELRAHPMPREWRPDIDTALVMVRAVCLLCGVSASSNSSSPFPWLWMDGSFMPRSRIHGCWS